MQKLVAYYRVSTKKQGDSGLGLDGQRSAVAAFAASTGGQIVAEFTEVESGRRDDRPELAKAVTRARRARSRLVVAKLDRMSRSARMLLELLESGVDVAFCDLPQIPAGAVGRFVIGMMAQVAELEAGMISGRTKAALREYKENKYVSKRLKALYPDGVPPEVAAARGGKLGAELPECRNLTPEARAKGQRLGAAAAAAAAAEQARDLGPLARGLRDEGKTLAAVAAHLNELRYVTLRNKPWTPCAVLRLLNRAG